MIERINTLMLFYSLGASEFADEIGLLRSTFSHILSGRNKPGMELLEKIMVRFPAVNLNWLIGNAGEMIRSTEPILDVRQSDLTDFTGDSHPSIDLFGQATSNKEPIIIDEIEGVVIL
ncbi:MAG: helix-turn-helix transcriptional regulator, partial [Bacteroidota bacterium]|nr:helix-turn-helix transcriptional regulator [Bacteroidota bacterium]